MHGEMEDPSKDWKFLLKASGELKFGASQISTKLDAFVFSE
jgi:hypothetical protein